MVDDVVPMTHEKNLDVLCFPQSPTTEHQLVFTASPDFSPFARFSRFELVTTSLRQLLQKLGDGGGKHSSTCFVTHATRNDIILGET